MRDHVVRVDGDDPDATVGELTLELVDPALPGEHVRAVVARLDEDEHRRVGVLLERVVAAVDAGKVEGRCGGRSAHVRASSSCSRLGTGDGRPSGRRYTRQVRAGSAAAPAGSTSTPSTRIVGEPGNASSTASSWVKTSCISIEAEIPCSAITSLEQSERLRMRRAALPEEEFDGHDACTGDATRRSSTGPAPGTTAAASRAWRSVVRTISFARAKLSSIVGTGPTSCPSA